MHRTSALAAVAALASCHRRADPPPPPPPPPDVVPRAGGPIAIDGEWDEPDWANRALRYVLTDASGAPARPASEVRVLRDDRELFLALYAADENITTSDRFELTLGYASLQISAAGAIEPAIPGVRAKVGLDEGTLDDPRDDDEEWVVELAIPLATFADDLTLRVARCDTPKGGSPRCGALAAVRMAVHEAVVYPTTR